MIEVWPRRLEAFRKARCLPRQYGQDRKDCSGEQLLTISAMASSSSSSLLSLNGRLFSRCCFRAPCPFLGADVGSEGLERAERRPLDSKAGDGTEIGCDDVKLGVEADRDLPPRLDSPELMADGKPDALDQVCYRMSEVPDVAGGLQLGSKWLMSPRSLAVTGGEGVLGMTLCHCRR